MLGRRMMLKKPVSGFPVNYDNVKPVSVTSAVGAPTISKAQCFKITNGDDSTTGTGDIVLDWTNIASRADIGVFDENNILLDYYFESFDPGANTAVIWVHRDWVRDDSTQAKITYGNGPSDQSVVANTVFDKETNLIAGYLFNESSGDLLDVTSNNNDGTLNGATQGATGQTDGAYDFDGANDSVSLGDKDVFQTFPLTYLIWFKTDITNTNQSLLEKGAISASPGGGLVIQPDGTVAWNAVNPATGHGCYKQQVAGGAISVGVWYLATGVWSGQDADPLRLYIDDTEVSSSTYGNIGADPRAGLAIGRVGHASVFFFDGLLDNARIYNTVLNPDEISAIYASTKSNPDFFAQAAGQ